MTSDFPRKNSYSTEDIFIVFFPFIAPESFLFTEGPKETRQTRKTIDTNGVAKYVGQGGNGGLKVDYFYKEG